MLLLIIIFLVDEKPEAKSKL